VSLSRAASIADLRLLAKKRLPGFAFDFIDGGAEDEVNLAKNENAFDDIEIVPRYLVDVSTPILQTDLFGTTYGVPFGMAPVGFLNMAWPGSDLMVARLAAEKQFPHVISTNSSTSIEQIAEAANGFAWFQLYASKSEALVDELLSRCTAAQIDILLLTVDVPQPGKRDRDIRNDLKIPFSFTLPILADLATHPQWSLSTLLAGAPSFGNFEKSGTMSLIDVHRRVISDAFNWDDLRRLRDRWPGRLLLKGILHPDDAVQAIDAGCDGVVVSNHGGRQADYSPAAITALPGIADAVGGRAPVLLDSGIRRGGDIIRAKALGADFTFAGRAFAYGLGAGATAGCHRAYDILELELTRALGQIGSPSFHDISSEVLAKY